ncbi:MAG: RNA 3'-phosphate cyclase [Candidatus Hecatellales archaeon]|nr:MAG: RNA 3'-phosphate cyclase [Candidatus Hecatellales archaeon]
MAGRVEVDGSLLEGGGQILRTSVALSALTGRPARIFNVRAKRNPPGLRLQHLAAIRSVAMLTDAEVEGLEVGSLEVGFNPKTIKGGSFSFDVGSAGSITLILQALAPVAAYAPSPVELEIVGGTNTKWSPPVEYLEEVLLPTLRRMGFEGRVETVRRGFYPQGGGIVKAFFKPVHALKPLEMVSQSRITRIRGLAYSCRLPRHVSERMAHAARRMLENAGYSLDLEMEVLQHGNSKCSVGPGCGIILIAEFENGDIMAADSLGEKGKPAEKVGREAAESLLSQIGTGAPVDTHLADQLIVWMALAEGVSKIRAAKLSLHTLTAIEVCKTFMEADFHVEGGLGETATITCQGIGMKNRFIGG